MSSLHDMSTYQETMTDVFGGERWKQLYKDQPTLEGSTTPIRNRDWKKISSLYKDQLKDAFGARYLSDSLILKNSRGSPLFELIFCTGNPGRRAIKISHDIARYIIDYKVRNGSSKTRPNSRQQTLDV